MSNIKKAQFRSCNAKVDVLEAVLAFISAATLLLHSRGWMVALPLALGGIWLCVRAHHERGRPYVEVHDGRLIIYAGRRIMHDLDMSSLVGTRSGWNKTILVFGDGREVAVNHMGFSTGDEADSFRKALKGLNAV